MRRLRPASRCRERPTCDDGLRASRAATARTARGAISRSQSATARSSRRRRAVAVTARRRRDGGRRRSLERRGTRIGEEVATRPRGRVRTRGRGQRRGCVGVASSAAIAGGVDQHERTRSGLHAASTVGPPPTSVDQHGRRRAEASRTPTMRPRRFAARRRTLEYRRAESRATACSRRRRVPAWRQVSSTRRAVHGTTGGPSGGPAS